MYLPGGGQADIWNEGITVYRRAINNDIFSGQLLTLSQRTISRGRNLCQAVHDRRRRPDFFYRLAKHAQTFPQMRRFLPLCGGAPDYRLQVETDERDGVCVCRLSGEVDLATVTVLQDALGQIQNSRRVVLDCHQLTYIDSTGLTLLVRLRERGYRFVIVAAPPALQKVVRVIGLHTLIPLARTREEALRVLTDTGRLSTNE